jgi:hypothetical protein
MIDKMEINEECPICQLIGMLCYECAEKKYNRDKNENRNKNRKE